MWIRRISAVFVSMVMLAVGAITAHADESIDEPVAVATTVTGRLIDQNGWPIAKMTVSTVDHELNLGSATTDKNGDFRLQLLLSKTTALTLSVNEAGFWQFRSSELVVTSVLPGQTRNLGTVRISSTANPARHKKAIKTSSKKAVKKAYRNRHAKQVRNEKLVKVTGCKVAPTPKAMQKRELRAVNFFRSLAGLAPVKLNAKLSKAAQKAALIQYHQGYLNHTPAKKAKCYTKAGAAASNESNLSMGWVGAGNMNGYMIDPGMSNTPVGHRRWIMSPGLTKIGTGYAGSFNALHVLSPSKESAPTPRWLTWPTAGYFPSQLEPWGRWSFMTARSDLSFKKAKVTVKVNGKKQKIKLYRGVGEYGNQNGLTWDFAKIPQAKGKKTTVVKVAVSGITLRGSTTLPTVNYQVKLFNG